MSDFCQVKILDKHSAVKGLSLSNQLSIFLHERVAAKYKI